MILNTRKAKRIRTLGKLLFVVYILFLLYFLIFSDWYGRSGVMENYHYNLTPFYEIKRFFVKKSIKNKNFSIISNNCWAGRVYQYLDMPYLSPTAGLYFFAPDYIKFVSDLRKYLDTPLRFINPEESKYYDEIKKRNQTDKPIGILDDVEIVFLHYKTKEEAEKKWNRRKERVNFDNIIIKFSRMDLCTEKEIEEFDRGV